MPNFDKLNEAVSLHQRNRLPEAEEGYISVLESDPKSFEAAYRLGLIYLQLGTFEKAEQAFLRAAKINRKSPDAHHHLGVAFSGLDRHDEAIRSYQKALNLRPDYPESLASLGFALQSVGKVRQAITQFRAALRLRPGFGAALTSLGIALQVEDQFEDAAVELEKAVQLDPANFEARKNLAHVFGKLERYEEARTQYLEALALKPDDRDCRIGLGNVLSREGRADQAIETYEDLLRTAPDDMEARLNLGETLHMGGRSEEAIDQYHRVLESHREEPRAYRALGAAHHALGNQKEATEAFEKVVALAPGRAGCFWNLTNARRVTPGDRHFQTMQSLAREADSLDPNDQIDLHFALGKAYADTGDQQRSFQHVVRGNAIVRSISDYDEPRALAHHQKLRDVFSADLIAEKSGAGFRSDLPVFVIGMPRSGTTLIEQILASHPQVHGAGELRDFATVVDDHNLRNESRYPDWIAGMTASEQALIGEEYVRGIVGRAPSAKRIVDKMPHNFSFAGLIHLALPNANIIYARRDLRDVAFSCFSILFSSGQDYTYNLAELGRYANSYAKLMRHWNEVLPKGAMLDVCYEDLVADLESHARRIVAYCGLEWDDACLSFYKTRRPVRTASATQVRQPIYNSSIGRWKPHQAVLEPLLKALSNE